MIAKQLKKYYILVMKINIVCVGKIKEHFFTDAINELLGYTYTLINETDFKAGYRDFFHNRSQDSGCL